jgi:putative membrane protein
MIIFFILGLVLGALAVIFAFQNSDIISVVFMGWHIDGSLSVILALSVLTGILIALLLTLPELITNYFQYRSLRKKNLELQEELRKQKELALFANKHAPTESEISHIEEGSITHNQ